MTAAELACEQIKTLPEAQVREVLDFIGYLKEKGERAEWEDLMHAQTTSLADVWSGEGYSPRPAGLNRGRSWHQRNIPDGANAPSGAVPPSRWVAKWRIALRASAVRRLVPIGG